MNTSTLAHSTASKLLTAIVVSVCALGVSKPAAADTFTVQYFTVPAGSPDFYIASSTVGGVSNNYVLSQLGPDGMPVFNPNYTSASGTVDPVSASNLNGAGEILWWTPGGNVTAAGTGSLNVTAAGVNMFPANQHGTDSPDELTAILNGTFDLATYSAVTFNVGADDDAFVYVDGTLVESLGGIHAATPAPTSVVDLNAGEHSIEIFYADQKQTRASLNFSDATQGIVVSAPPATPEPNSLALLGTGMIAVGGMMRCRFKRSGL